MKVELTEPIPYHPSRSTDVSIQEQMPHRSYLEQYAELTYAGIASLTNPDTGWPADKVVYRSDGTKRIGYQTSPTNIGLHFFVVDSARHMGYLSDKQAQDIQEKSLTTLAKAATRGNFFYNWYDSRTGKELKIWPESGNRTRPFLSVVDNGWLAAGLRYAYEINKNKNPKLAQQAKDLVDPMNFGRFYNPYDNTCERPWWDHPGQLRGGSRGSWGKPEMEFTRWHYGAMTEALIASYMGIAKGDIPPEHFHRLFRTLPPEWKQNKKPKGQEEQYVTADGKSVTVFEGYYTYENARHEKIDIVPTWGGSMFEELMVPMVVPQREWGTQSWKINLENYPYAQMLYALDQGNTEWGISPSADPTGYDRGAYDAWVAPPLGMARRRPRRSKPPLDSVVTMHASTLALEIAPDAAVDNMQRLENKPGMRGPYGGYDAYRGKTGEVAQEYLSLDLSMTFLPIVNHLCKGYVRNGLKEFLQPIKELLEQTRFSIQPISNELKQTIYQRYQQN